MTLSSFICTKLLFYYFFLNFKSPIDIYKVYVLPTFLIYLLYISCICNLQKYALCVLLKNNVYISLNYKLSHSWHFHQYYAFRSIHSVNLLHKECQFPIESPILPCFALCLWEREWLLPWYVWERLAGMLCSALPIFSHVLAACRGSTLSSAQRWRLCLPWFSGNGSLFSHTKLYFPMLHYPTIRVIFWLPRSLSSHV